MLKLTVVTKEESFKEFLNTIGTNTEGDNFLFYDKDFLLENLVDYFYMFLKNEIISELTDSNMEEEFIKSSYYRLPISKKRTIKEDLLNVLGETLSQRNMILEFEAIKTFRLRIIKQNFKEAFEDCLNQQIRDSKHNQKIDSLKQHVLDNRTEATVVIRTFENSKIGLFNEFNEIISLSDFEEQDDIVVNAIVYAPKTVKVEDDYNLLFKETIIILKQIFGEEVKFTG